MASTSKAFNKCVDPCPRYLRWHTQSLRLLFGQGARTRCPWGENLCATNSTFAGRRHMIGKVVTGCVAILPYHTATQDRGSECRDFGFISRIVTALMSILINNEHTQKDLFKTLHHQFVTQLVMGSCIHMKLTVCKHVKLVGMWRDLARSDVSHEIRVVSRERDDILAKHFSLFTLELHH